MRSQGFSSNATFAEALEQRKKLNEAKIKSGVRAYPSYGGIRPSAPQPLVQFEETIEETNENFDDYSGDTEPEDDMELVATVYGPQSQSRYSNSSQETLQGSTQGAFRAPFTQVARSMSQDSQTTEDYYHALFGSQDSSATEGSTSMDEDEDDHSSQYTSSQVDDDYIQRAEYHGRVIDNQYSLGRQYSQDSVSDSYSVDTYSEAGSSRRSFRDSPYPSQRSRSVTPQLSISSQSTSYGRQSTPDDGEMGDHSYNCSQPSIQQIHEAQLNWPTTTYPPPAMPLETYLAQNTDAMRFRGAIARLPSALSVTSEDEVQQQLFNTHPSPNITKVSLVSEKELQGSVATVKELNIRRFEDTLAQSQQPKPEPVYDVVHSRSYVPLKPLSRYTSAYI